MTGTLSSPSAGSPRSTEEPKIATGITTLNGLLTSSNLLDGAQLGSTTVPNAALAGSIAWSKMLGTSVQAQLGVNDGTTVSRGVTNIDTAETTTSTSYTTLTTPDQVASVVLPTNGLMFIAYQAQWKAVAGNGSRAAIFLGSNQLKKATADTTPQVQEAQGGGANGKYALLAATLSGLADRGGSADIGDSVTTGQILGLDGSGSYAAVFAAAGTYTVSIQFKAPLATTITVKNRTLRVWTMGF